MLFAAKMMTAQLVQNQRQQKTSIGAVMTVTATDGVLQDSQMLQIAEAKAGEAELRCVATRANHGGITIRGLRREIQSRPTEELLPGFRSRCTVSITALREE